MINRYMKPIHTQTYVFNIHDTQVSQTCKQASLWDITNILDVENKPHQWETAENRRETNHIAY